MHERETKEVLGTILPQDLRLPEVTLRTKGRQRDAATEAPANDRGVFARRFAQARELAQLTQEQVAVAAGIDELSASARISQYETGKHVPRYEIAARLSAALQVPVEFLYAADDETAELLLLWRGLTPQQRTKLLQSLRGSA